MFIRKKANKGGSYSILLVIGERVPGKKHVVSRVVKHFGSATTEAALEKLWEEARQYKAQLEASMPKKARSLKINGELDLASCYTYHVGFSDVYGHLFQQTFSTLPLTSTALRQLADVTILRIALPGSKRKTAAHAKDYGVTLTHNAIYRMMDRLTPSVIDAIKQAVYQRTTALLADAQQPVSVLFYDLTTVYFETCTQDAIRDFGFSKDEKHQHVQIMLAVIVTQEGLPIDYEEFPGNCYEGHTLLPVIEKLQTRYSIGQAILVADAGLMNTMNLEELTRRNIHYIIAARIKNLKNEVKQHMVDLTSYHTIHPSPYHSLSADDALKAKKIKLDDGSWLIAYHSRQRARKDAWDRENNLEKIKHDVASSGKNKLTARLKKPYVMLKQDCRIEIDPDQLNHAQAYDGLFGLQTNLKNPKPIDVLAAYRGLWQVEQTFRIAKSSLHIRPVFHYSVRRIRAHFAICYMALALVRYAQCILNQHQQHTPADQLHALLDQVCVTRIQDRTGHTFEILQDHPPNLKTLYAIFGLPWRRKFT